jgi:hypothetical protein
LVERQLCKLEVRGSNPLASINSRSEIQVANERMRILFDRWGAERES